MRRRRGFAAHVSWCRVGRAWLASREAPAIGRVRRGLAAACDSKSVHGLLSACLSGCPRRRCGNVLQIFIRVISSSYKKFYLNYDVSHDRLQMSSTTSLSPTQRGIVRLDRTSSRDRPSPRASPKVESCLSLAVILLQWLLSSFKSSGWR